MHDTHDFIEEKECDNCKTKVPYYELEAVNVINQWEKKLLCEYCIDRAWMRD